MQIDWITVTAQIVNFLVLVWLLKRFLYQPVMGAMDRREARIAQRLKDAAGREEAAEDARRRFERKEGELDTMRERLLDDARAQATEEKKRHLEQARSEIARAREQWQRQAAEEKAEFLARLRRTAAQSVSAIARQVLADLADADLEHQVAAVLIVRLHDADDDLVREFARQDGPVTIASSVDISAQVREQLERALEELFDRPVEVEYDHSETVLFGIEVTCGGRRISWSAAEYMELLEARLSDVFDTIGGVGAHA